ncbi:hypothetical protein CLOSTMETH_02961 [[Clostridium] methylpentosum DSM 5476]|uniref:Uncharacterized protein n=1 Tax=[Clostridium] methylpentosum DSM 5476 TaxID=537013 RepID=C0EGG8_9FIRM|nr:hypothetical protein CLOSTMETH_02961 [[Clostridium] methylpentosum DSM 5476]
MVFTPPLCVYLFFSFSDDKNLLLLCVHQIIPCFVEAFLHSAVQSRILSI